MASWYRGAACVAALCAVCGALRADDSAQSAPAANLELLTTDIQLSADGSVVQTVHSELHAINDAGAMQVSHIDLPFNAGMQELEIVEAHTLKPDGTKIPVDTSTIYEQLPENAAQTGMVTDQRVKLLLFPQFAAGDTAVYTVRFKTEHPYFAGEYFYGEIFPRIGAFKEVRETLTAPKSLALRVETHQIQFSKTQQGDNVVYSWHYSAPNPQTVETSLVSTLDREPRFFVSSFKDYAELGRAYAALAAPKIVVTPKVQALANQITGAETDRREQARKLYEWVAKHIRYVAVELGRGSFVPHDADAILLNGYGDCKDHDVLLQAMLKAKGIEAQSVLINSSNAYTLTEAPTFTQLDHVITWVPELGVYLDSSTAIAPFGILPLQEYGKPVVLASASGASQTTLPVLPPGLTTITTRTDERLDSQGNLSGTTTTSATGPFSIALRLIGLGIQALGPEKSAAMQLAARGMKDATGKFTSDAPLDLGPGYTITGTFTSPGWTDWLTGSEKSVLPGGLRVVAVTGDGFMGPIYPGDVKDSDPTPCFSGRAAEDVTLTLPDGMTVRALPRNENIATENLTFTAHWTVSHNLVAVHREFSSTVNQPVCSGALRTTTAAALKQIADSYDAELSLVREGAAGAEATPSSAAEDEATYDRAVDFIRKGDIKQGVQLLSDLLASGHPLSQDFIYGIHWSRAAAYLQDNQPAKAIEDASEAIRLKPDASMVVYRIRGGAYLSLGKRKLAADDFSVVLKQSPDDVGLRQIHASLSEELGDYDSAADDFDVLVKSKPNDVWTVLRRASLRKSAGRYEGAAADYERAGDLGAQTNVVLSGLCETLAHTDRLADAVYQCSRALSAYESSGPDLEARGYAYFRQGKLGEALGDFEKACRVFPQNMRYLYERGVVKMKMGDKAGGQKDMDTAAAKSPGVARAVPPKMAQ